MPTWMEQVLAGFVEVIEFDRVLRGSLGRRQCCCSVRWWIGHAGSGTRAGRG